jgi:hypothetical protein
MGPALGEYVADAIAVTNHPTGSSAFLGERTTRHKTKHETKINIATSLLSCKLRRWIFSY